MNDCIFNRLMEQRHVITAVLVPPCLSLVTWPPLSLALFTFLTVCKMAYLVTQDVKRHTSHTRHELFFCLNKILNDASNFAPA